MNVQNFYSSDDQAAINRAVEEAETQTSAEIVPVLADSSGRYDRAEDMCGVLVAIIAVIVCWICFQAVDYEAGWSMQSPAVLKYNLPLVILTFVAAFTIGTVVATKVWCIRSLFTPRAIKETCVGESALQAFHEYNLGKTAEATGVLIYISLFERMVYVMGDATIAGKLTNDDFGEVRDAILAGMKSGRRGEGLCDGIKLCGEKLSADFPIKDDDVDELPNSLRIWQRDL